MDLAKRILIVIIAFVTSMNVAWAGEFLLSAEQRAILNAGEAVVVVGPDPRGAAGLIMAAIDIPVAPRQLWTTMLDCERASQFISGLKSCRILDRDPQGTWDVREHLVQWLWVMPTTRSEFRSEYTLDRRISFQRTGGDLKTLEGEWRLAPVSGRNATRLTYMVRIDPGVSLPGPMVRAAIETDLPKTLKALRDAAVSGPTVR